MCCSPAEDAVPLPGSHRSRQQTSKLRRQSKLLNDSEVNGYFILSNMALGEGTLSVLPEVPSSIAILERSESSDSEDISILGASQFDAALNTMQDLPINHGTKFTAGQLEFTLSALPLNQLLLIRAFRAARNGDLCQLKSIFDYSVTVGTTLPHVVITPATDSDHNRYSTVSVISEQGLDVNSEYQSPKYDDEPWHGLNRRHSSMSIQQSKRKKAPHRLLLHVAIETKKVGMVKFFLGKGADVSVWICLED